VFDSNNWPREGLGLTIRVRCDELLAKASELGGECLTPSRVALHV
jgi:hypothetical protein